MENHSAELKLLLELDERHDELLRQIDDLDKQVAAVLAQWTADRDEHARQREDIVLGGTAKRFQAAAAVVQSFNFSGVLIYFSDSRRGPLLSPPSRI